MQEQERMYKALRGLGYSGQFQSMFYQYLKDKGYGVGKYNQFQEMYVRWIKDTGGEFVPVVTYDPDAIALFARFNEQATDERKKLISDRFVAGKATTWWPKLDALWVHAAHGQEAGRLNWLSTRFNCLPVNSPQFTVDRGYAGDGVTSYLDSQFNPAIETTANYKQDSASLGIRSNSAASSSGSLAGFYDGSKGTTIQPRDGNGRMGIRVNTSSYDTGSNGSIASAVGMFVVTRLSPSLSYGYQDGVAKAGSNKASSTPANGTLRLGAISADSLRAAQFSMGFIGAGLTAEEVMSIYDWFQPYKNAVGVV